MNEKRILTKVEYLEFTAYAGEQIHDVISAALSYSVEKRMPVRFTFNDTVVCINAEKIVMQIAEEQFFGPRDKLQRAKAEESLQIDPRDLLPRCSVCKVELGHNNTTGQCEKHGTFAEWWDTKGYVATPKAGLPPEHATIAELAWKAALASIKKEVLEKWYPVAAHADSTDLAGMCVDFEAALLRLSK